MQTLFKTRENQSKTMKNLSKTKKEVMFIQMLEGLHETEAEVLCLVKDKKLGKKFRITKNVVAEAFPSINWGVPRSPGQ